MHNQKRRFVKYILQEALRIVGEETDYIEAPASAYERAFDTLVDMIVEWNLSNHCLIERPPESMGDVVNADEPVTALIYNLAINLAPKFRAELTQDTYTRASTSFAALKSKHKRLPCWNRPDFMPRGSANIFPYYFMPPYAPEHRHRHDHSAP